jgi:hypothetical protein
MTGLTSIDEIPVFRAVCPFPGRNVNLRVGDYPSGWIASECPTIHSEHREPNPEHR